MTTIHNWPGVRPGLRLVTNNDPHAVADAKVREVRQAFDEVLDVVDVLHPRVPRIPARGRARIPVKDRQSHMTPLAWRLLPVLAVACILAVLS